MSLLYCQMDTNTPPYGVVTLLRSRYENATPNLYWVYGLVHYWVSSAINKGGFFEIAFVVVVDKHLPRFEALAYVFLTLTH